MKQGVEDLFTSFFDKPALVRRLQVQSQRLYVPHPGRFECGEPFRPKRSVVGQTSDQWPYDLRGGWKSAQQVQITSQENLERVEHNRICGYSRGGTHGSLQENRNTMFRQRGGKSCSLTLLRLANRWQIHNFIRKLGLPSHG